MSTQPVPEPKKYLLFGLNSVEDFARLLVTDWDEQRLNCVVAHLQLLHWKEMPIVSPFKRVLSGNDVYSLLLTLYPRHVWRLDERQNVRLSNKQPLCLDLLENWEYFGSRTVFAGQQERNNAVFWSDYSYEEQRDIMLRHLYEQARQNCASLTFIIPPAVAQVARAFYIGEVTEEMDLRTTSGKRAEYPIREFAHGCNRLHDDRVALAVGKNIICLENEGNLSMLQSLVDVLLEEMHALAMRTVSNSGWLQNWQENLERLHMQAEAALVSVRNRDAQELAALAERCRVYAQTTEDVPTLPMSINAFREALERRGLDADGIWPLAVRAIAAEMQIDAMLAAKYLTWDWNFIVPFAQQVRDGKAAVTVLAQMIHEWRKGRLQCGLSEVEERSRHGCIR